MAEQKPEPLDCSNCDFYNGDRGQGEKAEGECTRRPPQLVFQGCEKVYWMNPEVSARHFCGGHSEYITQKLLEIVPRALDLQRRLDAMGSAAGRAALKHVIAADELPTARKPRRDN